jgi:hypothetical protein
MILFVGRWMMRRIEMSVCCDKCGKKLTPYDRSHNCIEDLKTHNVELEVKLDKQHTLTKRFKERAMGRSLTLAIKYEEWDQREKELRAEIERLRKERDNFFMRMFFYMFRAAAWKQCAKRWKAELHRLFKKSGLIGQRVSEFDPILLNVKDTFVFVDKAPPDWREKWVKPPQGEKETKNDTTD